VRHSDGAASGGRSGCSYDEKQKQVDIRHGMGTAVSFQRRLVVGGGVAENEPVGVRLGQDRLGANWVCKAQENWFPSRLRSYRQRNNMARRRAAVVNFNEGFYRIGQPFSGPLGTTGGAVDARRL